MTATLEHTPAQLPIQILDAEVESHRKDDAGAARFIGVVLSIMFLYSLLIMVYVYWLTVQASAS